MLGANCNFLYICHMKHAFTAYSDDFIDFK